MSGLDLTALYREDATLEEQVKAFQHMIDTGDAWRTEGSIGRACMEAIDAGYCVLPEQVHRNAYGGMVPSRNMLEPGTKGTIAYAIRVNRDGPRGWE